MQSASAGVATMVGKAAGFSEVMRRKFNPPVADDPSVTFAEYDPIIRARATVPRREFLQRLKSATAPRSSAVRLSVNGMVELSGLFGSRQYSPQNDQPGGWTAPDYSLVLASDWERTGDVSVCVDDPTQLASIASKMKDDALVIDAWRNADTGDSGLTVRGSKAEFELSATDAATFPVPGNLETDSVVMLESAALLHALEQTVYACDANSTRYALGGVLVELTADGLTLAATDSRRLAKIDAPAQTCNGFQPLHGVIPCAALELAIGQLKKTSGPVALAIGGTIVEQKGTCNAGSEFQLEAEGWTLRGKLVQGRFPDYKRVIPSSFGHYLKMERAALLEAIDTAYLATNEESRGMDFVPNVDGGTLTLRTSGRGKANVTIPAESAVDTKPVDCITFDPKYVLEYLKRCDAPEVVLAMVDHQSAAVLEGEGCATYILMPLTRDR